MTRILLRVPVCCERGLYSKNSSKSAGGRRREAVASRLQRESARDCEGRYKSSHPSLAAKALGLSVFFLSFGEKPFRNARPAILGKMAGRQLEGTAISAISAIYYGWGTEIAAILQPSSRAMAGDNSKAADGDARWQPSREGGGRQARSHLYLWRGRRTAAIELSPAMLRTMAATVPSTSQGPHPSPVTPWRPRCGVAS